MNYLIFLPLLVILNNTPNIDCPDISQFINIEIEISTNEVAFNDSLNLEIIFRNKTTETIEFYPYAYLFLARSTGLFHFESFVLNEITDFRIRQIITANDGYVMNKRISIESPFFRAGLNEFEIVYLINELKGEYIKDNLLCGYLESSTVKLYVNP